MKHTPLSIVATYAPHQGYTTQEKQDRWGNVQQALEQIPKHHMTIWGTDATGKLGRESTHTHPPKNIKKIIGPQTIQKHHEKGNRVKLANICKKHTRYQ